MAHDPTLTKEQMAQLRALENREPDTDDIPEAPAENWASARRGHPHPGRSSNPLPPRAGQATLMKR